jgi:RND family efflux transporter MFP subunit
MNDKTQLLRSLSIERSPAAPPTARRWPLLAASAVALVAAAVIGTVWLVRPDLLAPQPATPAAAQPQPSAPEPSAAATAEPRRASSLIASGYVVARRRATVAAEVTGKVVDLLVDEGMVVQEGQVLARLDSVLAEKDLALAKSRAEAAEAAAAAIAADLRDAERIYNRTQSLSQKSFASEADLTKSEARAAVLRAQQRQAQAQAETARLDAQRAAAVLEKHAIRAPFPGVVVERSAQPGEMISPMSAGGFTRTGICTLVDMDSIEIEVDVNEAFIGRISHGTEVEAILDAYPDWTIPGAVVAIVPTANREKATVKVRIGLKQKDPRILPDMAVKVTFVENVKPTARTETPSGAN